MCIVFSFQAWLWDRDPKGGGRGPSRIYPSVRTSNEIIISTVLKSSDIILIPQIAHSTMCVFSVVLFSSRAPEDSCTGKTTFLFKCMQMQCMYVRASATKYSFKKSIHVSEIEPVSDP